MEPGRNTLSSGFGRNATRLEARRGQSTLQATSRMPKGLVNHNPRGNYVPTAEERLAILEEVLTEAAGKGLLQLTPDDGVLRRAHALARRP